MTPRLVDLFVPHLTADALEHVGSLDQLDQALRDAVELARASFKELQLPTETFLIFLARRIPKDRCPEQVLAELKAADLYLVCACLERMPQAVTRFEAEYLCDVGAALARMETASVQIEDVKQLVCQKLLLGDGQHPPRLTSYSGKGDLRSWLCVVAVRAALDHLRREKKSTSSLDDGDLADAVSSEDDQELEYLKGLYRAEFKASFAEALASLTTRERNILRHQVLDGLTLDQIGAIYNVHRATIARWNARLRERLLSQTRRALLARLNTTRGEFESIMRLIQSHLDVSIRRHLDPDE